MTHRLFRRGVGKRREQQIITVEEEATEGDALSEVNMTGEMTGVYANDAFVRYPPVLHPSLSV